MKKLLQINSVLNWGSTGRIMEGIGQVAIAQGWDSYVACGRQADNPSCSQVIRIGSKYDVMLHGLSSRLFDRHGLASKRATLDFIDQVKAISPDIIHLHNLHGYYLNIKVLFNYLAHSNIPLIWTLHDCWAMTGHCAHFDYVGCEKWKSGCHNCIQKYKYPKSIFLDYSEKNYFTKAKCFTSVQNMVIVPVSQWLQKIVQQSFLQKYSTEVIYNGIDLHVFTDSAHVENNIRVQYGIGDRFMILGVSNVWEERKGLHDFLALREKLGQEYVIVLVGLTPQQKKQMPSGIIGIERTQSVEELAAFYRAADIYANLTWEDNFPTTNLEALACGTPVLTYKTGGSVEAVSEDTGFVVSQGDFNSILKVIKIVKKKGKECYRSFCRERASILYDKDKQFAKYINLYEESLCLKTKFY